MSVRARGAYLLALLPGLGAGCGGLSGGAELSVISVGERGFTQADLDRFVDSRTGLGASLDAPLLSALLDEFAREQLLLLAADEAGIEVSEIQLLSEIGALDRGPRTEAVQAESEPGGRGAAEGRGDGSETATSGSGFRSQVEDRLRVRQLIETVVLAGLEASEETARLEFETSRAFYARPDTVTLSEQRFTDRSSAEAAARPPPDEPANEDGAHAAAFLPIGTFRRGQLPEVVEQAVFGLGPGETTGVVETAAGFRVFRVDERMAATALEFEEVEDVVRLTVLRREADARIETFVAELRRRHPVTIHSERLDFPYVGLLRE